MSDNLGRKGSEAKWELDESLLCDVMELTVDVTHSGRRKSKVNISFQFLAEVILRKLYKESIIFSET